MTHDELRDLCAIQAIGGLDAEERAAIESHLEECPECRRLVAAHSEAAAGLAVALPPVTPSPELRLRIQDAVSGRSASPHLVPKGSLPFWALPAATAATMIFGIFMGTKLEERNSTSKIAHVRSEFEKLRAQLDSMEAEALAEKKFMPSASMGELAGVGGAASLGRVFWQGEEVHIMAANLPAPPSGKGYQVWALVEGMKPMPGAVFMPDKDGLLKGSQTIAGVPPGQAVKFAVTLEPIAGVKQPTGPMVLEPPKPK
ncbi:MAG: anti-sigma factor [Planctomycetota bacterium]